MSDDSADFDQDPFISLGYLLTNGIPNERAEAPEAAEAQPEPLTNEKNKPKPVSTGAIATVIEEKGIQGWDRYGRFTRFTTQDKDDKAAHFREALDAVALQAKHFFEEQPDEPSPAANGMTFFSVFERYGWRQSELPDFSEAERSQPASPRRPSQSKRRDNATALLIAVMKLMLVNDAMQKDLLDDQEHVYETQKDLIDEIISVARRHNLPGLSKSTLDAKFSEATRILRHWLEKRD